MMRSQLIELEEANRSDNVMCNDSLAEALVEYFDKHGTANERMRAYYILGRTYFDLGELPRALETYLVAADCADTTSQDCDYKTLSRVFAQTASVYDAQIQPQSQLTELRKAGYYAKRAKDTLMYIECLANHASVYRKINEVDSVIFIEEYVSDLFLKIGRVDRSVQSLCGAITSLIKKGDTVKAKKYIDLYERYSGLFDSQGKIRKGREIYYYIKGEYYLAVEKIDSAELLFRELLNTASTLNQKIAGCKGLQAVYHLRHQSDSIAKYADMGYDLNDSAYSLSEMQNIQMLQASYNYNHNKLLAEQNRVKAERAHTAIIIIISVVTILIVLSLYMFSEYRNKKEEELRLYRQDLKDLGKAQGELLRLREEQQMSEDIIKNKNEEIYNLQCRVVEYQSKMEKTRKQQLETRLTDSSIVKRLKASANANPPHLASLEEFRELQELINQELPQFYSTLNTDRYTLKVIEYDVCLLLRVHFPPSDICRLTGITDGYASNMRKRLLERVFGISGSPKDFDNLIWAIK